MRWRLFACLNGGQALKNLRRRKGFLVFNGFRLGKILGVEIAISYSWFFIFAMVTVLLTFGIFPEQFPQHSLVVNIILGLITSALFFGSLLFHEMSHAIVANFNKIPIKKITLFIFGGMAQMSREPTNPASELKMAVAGPLSSMFLALVFYLLYRLLLAAGLPSPYYASFTWLWEINLMLAIFNLAPGFPLDGGRVFRAVLWMFTNDMDKATKVASKTGQGFAFLLMGVGFLLMVSGNLGGIWFILIGWFLYQSAVAGYQQLLLEHGLADVKVSEIMTENVETVSPEITLQELVNEKFLKYRFGRFPIVDGDDLLGIVTLHDIKEIPRSKWASATAGEVVETLEEPMYIHRDDPAVNAITKMAREEIGHLLVVDEENHLVGIVTRADIIHLMKLKSELKI